MNKIAAIIGCSGCLGIMFLFPSGASAISPALMTFDDVDNSSGAMVMSEDVQKLTALSAKFGFLPPLDWKLAFSDKRGDMTMAEFIPSNESLNDWSRLVCMQGFKGLANDVEPDQFLDSMAATYQENCEGKIVYQQLGSSKVGGLEAVHGLLGCTSMPNIHHSSAVVEASYISRPQGEMGYFTVISDDENVYLIHKSIRTAIFTIETVPITIDNYRAFMSQP
ncbi:hypothetical protein EGC86_08875 [Shewanella frigidimarina]|uniref:hypothetical protein n=1 Tax=Shewanella frigidimarina TaxID=56812 RepID=UPI000F4FB155|nr:hypothetical protein [Shewanella frigidimarina]RPA63183.1 hypothetical protein EGC86_08875 [Shewanella frigidimarina]